MPTIIFGSKTRPIQTIAYLKAENAYADTVITAAKDLQKTLFIDEMKGHIKEEDQSVPSYDNGYYYYWRDGKQYSIQCRKKGSIEQPKKYF